MNINSSDITNSVYCSLCRRTVPVQPARFQELRTAELLTQAHGTGHWLDGKYRPAWYIVAKCDDCDKLPDRRPSVAEQMATIARYVRGFLAQGLNAEEARRRAIEAEVSVYERRYLADFASWVRNT